MNKQDKKGPQNHFGFKNFFALLQPTDEQRVTDLRYRLDLQRIKQRQRLVSELLSDGDSFSRYVTAHPLYPLIERKIAEEVALHELDLARVAESSGIESIEELSSLERYQALALNDYVEPSYLFPEFPPITHLCELNRLASAYSKMDLVNTSEELKILQQEWDRAIAYYSNRWQMLTGEPLHGPPFPPIAKLTQLIAPIPYSSTWTEELYSREARSMGHTPALADVTASVSTSTTGVGSGGSSPAGSGSSSSPVVGSSGTGCEVEDIYRLAGAPPLQQQQPTSGNARYTFPGNLRWGEDIFYDYAVMVPLDQCDIPDEIADLEARSREAARLSAYYAKGILQFLITQNLAGVLGAGVTGELDGILGDVLAIPPVDVSTLPLRPEQWDSAVPPGANKKAIRALRKRLKEKAALLRSISRMRLLFQPPGAQNFNSLIAALDSAIQPFDPSRLRNPNRYLPNDENSEPDPGERGISMPTLEIIDPNPNSVPYNEVTGSDYFDEGDPQDRWGSQSRGWFGLPNAKAELPERVLLGGTFEASYSTTKRHKALRRYLQYLGGPFYRNVVTLRDRAQEAKNSLNHIINTPQSNNVLSEFSRIAEGITNDALLALAQLFEDMAEQLALPAVTKGEGSKRLALMVVYRQFWFPEGYIAGKLVGYKNLLPNQKETLKRRTFVKTTRETTTAQEFATSREEDFTRSSKETAELVKEASSDFNFSLKTEVGFSFIVTGDVKTDLNTGRKEMSKAMHNRVAEATMKSSVKYNEKREVKIRELTEIEDVQEMTTEIQNLNREITANYFYYQLHRQYFVTTELAHIQPVLLRTREVPLPATIDNKFLADYAHIFLHALPRQLSVDLQETVGDIELLGRTFIRRRNDSDQKSAMYEQFRQSPMPATPEGQSTWRGQLEALERASSEASTAYIEAEENYVRSRTRLDRVITHVRENIHHYMQFVWHASPKVDQDKLLQDESFNSRPLGEVTRGFMRVGYYGNEEIFEYTGSSIACMNALSDDLIAGYQIVSRYTNEELRELPLFQRLKRYYPSDTDEMIVERIRSQIFIRDPASPEEINNSRHVQLAQDALVVEALPGQVPLLEGFQMAHRMLDVQKACLENLHLNERIKTKPWETKGEDNYTVVRREGEAGSLKVSVADRDSEKP